MERVCVEHTQLEENRGSDKSQEHERQASCPL